MYEACVVVMRGRGFESFRHALKPFAGPVVSGDDDEVILA